MKQGHWILAVGSVVLLILLHFPFLHADPDYFISIGRDAFTDEGLNTIQLRNYINHGYLSFDECDNLIKSPLFNFLLFLPLNFFGTYLSIARLTILTSILLMLAVLASNGWFRKLLPVLLCTTLMQYYVFQYSHFSLSEMFSVMLILCGAVLLYRFLIDRRQTHLFFSCLFFSAAYFAKIQFVYVIVIPPFALLISHLLKVSYSSFRVVAISLLWLILFIGIYLASWYFPHRGIFDFVLKDESSQKFAALAEMPQTIGFNIIHVLFTQQNWWFHLLSVLCFAIGIYVFRKSSEFFRAMFVVSSLWLVVEVHKLTMVYLPSRYLVSFYFAEGLMSSVVLTETLRRETGLIVSRASLCILIAFIAFNSFYYTKIFERRTFGVEAINHYFSAAIKDSSQPILGVWSTNATWDCKARCIPVWKDFMNDKDVFTRFRPQVILSEPNEDESNHAFSSQGIDLKAMADSTRSFRIGKWDVDAHWYH